MWQRFGRIKKKPNTYGNLSRNVRLRLFKRTKHDCQFGGKALEVLYAYHVSYHHHGFICWQITEVSEQHSIQLAGITNKKGVSLYHVDL
jgi:hypothetical protein